MLKMSSKVDGSKAQDNDATMGQRHGSFYMSGDI